LKKRIAIFASGSGSNAQKIMEHFKKHTDAEVAIVLTNNPEAYVLQRADNFEIPTHIFDKHEFYQTNEVLDLLKNLNIDIIVLAGFLWLVPDTILANYPKRIINIHPALLPKYGGKGMYGDRVHKEVLANGDEESGDGWKPCGRGFIQLTGKSNYEACGEALGVDLDEDPLWLTSLEGAARSAAWFWDQHDLNDWADKGDVATVSKKINGGTIGLDERKELYEEALKIFS
jgi:phosphoribosylglycinamide formyltransferase-1